MDNLQTKCDKGRGTESFQHACRRIERPLKLIFVINVDLNIVTIPS